MLPALQTFVDQQSSRFEDKNAALVVISWQPVIRYRTFLNMILGRLRSLREDPSKHQSYLQESLGGNLFGAIQLELETVYLFSKILLDKIAHAIEFYFGSARDCSLSSHDKATKCIREYAKAIGLRGSIDDVHGRMEVLKVKVSDYRDYQISHEPNSRMTKGLFISEGQVRFTASIVLPKGNEKTAEGEFPEAILQLIDDYLSVVFSLIRDNESKASRKLKRRGDSDPNRPNEGPGGDETLPVQQ